MRRAFYIALGVTIGVIAVRRATRFAESLSPDSIAASASRAITDFVADVREGMAERESELRAALDYDTDTDAGAGHGGADSGTL